MLEIVFNELSCTNRAESKGHAINVYSSFFSIADKISALKIAPVRIRMAIDLANISLSNDYFTLKDWLKTLDNEARQRYLGFIVQNPVIVENPYYYYDGHEAKGFGYAFNNNLGAISYFTDETWSNDTYKISREFLADADSDVITDIVTVNHCLIKDNSINHFNWLKDIYQIKQKQLLNDIANFNEFWMQRELIFQWLDLGNDVLEQIKEYSSIDDSNFKKATRYLHLLNNHLTDVNTKATAFDDLPGDVTNDGEATMKKFGGERIFQDHEGHSTQFCLHAKLGDVRIYLLPRKGEKRITVGYIGKHLRTKNFN